MITCAPFYEVAFASKCVNFCSNGFNVAIATEGCPSNILSGRYNTLVGTSFCCTGAVGNTYQYSYVLASCGANLAGYCCSGILANQGATMAANGTQCFTDIEKQTGKFVIPHPDPEKTYTHQLAHSFVESPTSGDTIYRYELTAVNGRVRFELPDYFKFLNKNVVTKVSPLGHFGKAYIVIDQDLSGFDLFANNDGKYNVFLLGTRKDNDALLRWKGAERLGV